MGPHIQCAALLMKLNMPTFFCPALTADFPLALEPTAKANFAIMGSVGCLAAAALHECAIGQSRLET